MNEETAEHVMWSSSQKHCNFEEGSKKTNSASFLCQKLSTRVREGLKWNKQDFTTLYDTSDLKKTFPFQRFSTIFVQVGWLFDTEVGVDFGSGEAQRMEKFLECKISNEAPIYMGDMAAGVGVYQIFVGVG